MKNFDSSTSNTTNNSHNNSNNNLSKYTNYRKYRSGKLEIDSDYNYLNNSKSRANKVVVPTASIQNNLLVYTNLIRSCKLAVSHSALFKSFYSQSLSINNSKAKQADKIEDEIDNDDDDDSGSLEYYEDDFHPNPSISMSVNSALNTDLINRYHKHNSSKYLKTISINRLTDKSSNMILSTTNNTNTTTNSHRSRLTFANKNDLVNSSIKHTNVNGIITPSRIKLTNIINKANSIDLCENTNKRNNLKNDNGKLLYRASLRSSMKSVYTATLTRPSTVKANYNRLNNSSTNLPPINKYRFMKKSSMEKPMFINQTHSNNGSTPKTNASSSANTNSSIQKNNGPSYAANKKKNQEHANIRKQVDKLCSLSFSRIKSEIENVDNSEIDLFDDRNTGIYFDMDANKNISDEEEDEDNAVENEDLYDENNDEDIDDNEEDNFDDDEEKLLR